MSYKYPYQIASAFSKNIKKGIITTLGIEAHFSLESGAVDGKEEAKVNPLEFHEGLSRFTLVLICKSEAPDKRTGKPTTYTKRVTANIPARVDADKIIARTKACENLLVMREYNATPAPAQSSENGQQGESIAYTTVLSMGTGLKGKTPAQVLTENGKNKDKLISQIDFLSQKVKEYPANQTQIDAIREAIALFDAKKLAATTAPAESAERAVTVYEANFKPLVSTLDEQGRVLVYSVTIRCIPSRNYPYEVTIKNTRAHWDGSVARPTAQDPHDEITMNIDEATWNGIVSDMERSLSAFTTYNFGKQFKKAEDANRVNRLKAVQEKSQTA